MLHDSFDVLFATQHRIAIGYSYLTCCLRIEKKLINCADDATATQSTTWILLAKQFGHI